MEPSEWINILEVVLWILGTPIGVLGVIIFLIGICTVDTNLIVYGAATFLPPVAVLLSFNRCWWICGLATTLVIVEWVIYARCFSR